RPWRFIHAVVLRILHHAHYLRPIAVHLQAPAEGVLPAPIAREHGLVYDGHARRVFVVGASEFAPGDERNAHSGEVAGADLVLYLVGGPSDRWFVTVDGNRTRGKRGIAERSKPGESGSFDSRERADALYQFILKSFGARLVIARRGQRYGGIEHPR